MSTEALPQAQNGQEGMEHLAPENYFTPPRIEEIGAALNRLGTINVENISPIE